MAFLSTIGDWLEDSGWTEQDALRVSCMEVK